MSKQSNVTDRRGIEVTFDSAVKRTFVLKQVALGRGFTYRKVLFFD